MLFRASPSQMQRKTPSLKENFIQNSSANEETSSGKRYHNEEENQVGFFFNWKKANEVIVDQISAFFFAESVKFRS